MRPLSINYGDRTKAERLSISELPVSLQTAEQLSSIAAAEPKTLFRRLCFVRSAGPEDFRSFTIGILQLSSRAPEP